MAAATKRSWKLQSFVAHEANVRCLSFGRKSGRVLVTGGDDKKVNLWAVGKANCILSLTGHTTPVECVRFGHTEELVCAGSEAGALKIWDLEAAKIVRTLTGHKSSVRCVDFHPYGDFLASGSSDTNLKLWDIRRKGCIFTYTGHSKTVNSIKFSPDGQWLASAGEDSLVKMWDLRAGKMLTELQGHAGSVEDVEFHPHEFLLASGSLDRTVIFWDLESFHQVSRTNADTGPVRCISYSLQGECLYSGSQDVLKVYGWEPARTYDTLLLGWGKVKDMAIAQDKMVGASFQVNSVGIYMVDLNRLQREGDSPDERSGCFSYNHTVRKSFIKQKSNGTHRRVVDLKTTIEESDRSGTDPEDDLQFMSDIKSMVDYKEVFKPSRSLCRTPPLHPQDILPPALASDPPEEDPLVPQVIWPLPVTASHSPPSSAPLPDVVYLKPKPEQERRPVDSPSPESSEPPSPVASPSRRAVSTRLEYGRSDSLTENTRSFPEPEFPVRLGGIRHCPSEPSLNQVGLGHRRSSSLSRSGPVASARVEPSKPLDRPALVRPIPKAVPNSEAESPDVVERVERERFEFVPMVTDKPAGLDVEEFLPKEFTSSRGYSLKLHEMSDSELFTSAIRGHESMVAVLTNRQRSLQVVHNLWLSKDLKTAIDSAIAMNDLAIVVDLLGMLTLRPSLWSLDLCVAFLPNVLDLLRSKYEMYVTVGCSTLRLILRNFLRLILTNINSPVHTVGVDISREERYNKSSMCYNHLVSIRAFLLKRQTVQGKLGQTFRDLLSLMQDME